MKNLELSGKYRLKYLYLYVYNNSIENNMIAANYTEFRTDLKKYLDDVEENNETLVIKRGKGKGTVLISLEEYNSMMETLHLLSSKANADRLYESLKQLNNEEVGEHELIEI